LEAAGFDYAPRVLGYEPRQGAERLTYIEGEVSMRPWPPYLASESGIVAVARLLREYHRAVHGYVPDMDSMWRAPGVAWRDGMIVRHGDLGPWNMVWRDGVLVGLIDWDLAEPGYAIEDVAQAAWYCVPLRPPDKCAESGIDPADQPRRLKVLCSTYGESVPDVLHALSGIQRIELQRLREWGDAGIEPWRSFAARGDIGQVSAESEWLEKVQVDLVRGSVQEHP